MVIYKVDAKDNSIRLSNTVFDIYDSKDNFVATIKTDNQGIARLNNIKIGTYKIIEKSTNEFYRVNTNEKTVEVKWANKYRRFYNDNKQ